MCTATWIKRPEGYDLFFTRDELKTRRIAAAPEMFEHNGIYYIAPIDTDSGGTWIAVNEFGIAFCLLNYYGKLSIPGRKSYVSRGLLVTDLVDCRSREEVINRLEEKNLQDYRSFHLALIDPAYSPVKFTWDSALLQILIEEDVQCPLSSSSFESEEVIRYRVGLYREIFVERKREATLGSLEKYHRSHIPKQSAYSVCMHREDAQSVSLSRVTTTAGEISFKYAPGPPCQTGFLDPVVMNRNVMKGMLEQLQGVQSLRD